MRTYLFIRFDRIARMDVSLTIKRFANDEMPQIISTGGAIITFFKSRYEHLEISDALSSIEPKIAFFLLDMSKTPITVFLPNSQAAPIIQFLEAGGFISGHYERQTQISQFNEPDDLRILPEADLRAKLVEATENEDYIRCALIRDILAERNY